MTLRLRLLAALSLVLLVVTPGAHAVDGVTLISQATAATGLPGCGSTGLPIVICQPGSYRLSGNITVSNPGATAIVINAGNVTLDLNGFAVTGFSSVPAIALYGIVTTYSEVEVENGEVTGFYTGVQLGGENETAHALRLVDVYHAIEIGSGSVTDTSMFSSIDGIQVQQSTGLIEGNNINGSGEGIEISNGHSLVLNNIVTGEFAGGIVFDAGASGGYGGNTLVNNSLNVSGGTSMNNNVCDSSAC